MLIAAVGAEEVRITNRVQGETTGIQEEWFCPLNENCISEFAFAMLDVSIITHLTLIDMKADISTDTSDLLMLSHSSTLHLLRSFCRCPRRLLPPLCVSLNICLSHCASVFCGSIFKNRFRPQKKN